MHPEPFNLQLECNCGLQLPMDPTSMLFLELTLLEPEASGSDCLPHLRGLGFIALDLYTISIVIGICFENTLCKSKTIT